MILLYNSDGFKGRYHNVKDKHSTQVKLIQQGPVGATALSTHHTDRYKQDSTGLILMSSLFRGIEYL